MKKEIIIAKAALDVGYCASKQIFYDISNSKRSFDVEDLFAIFAISRNWCLKTKLVIAQLGSVIDKTAEEFAQLSEANRVLSFLNVDFVSLFSILLKEQEDDVVSRVKTWFFLHGRYVTELLLLQEFFQVCDEARLGSCGCDDLWACRFHVNASVESLKKKLH